MSDIKYHAVSGSAAEDLFIELFSDTFGAEKAGYLYSQTISTIFTKMIVTPIFLLKTETGK